MKDEQLIGGLILLGLYMLAVWAFMYFVVPYIILILGLVLVLLAMAGYGWILYETYAPRDLADTKVKFHEKWRKEFAIPALVLLFLIYVDVAYLILCSLAVAPPVKEAFWALVSLQDPLIPLVYVPAPLSGAAASDLWLLPLLLGMCVKVLATWPLLYASRGMASTSVGLEQPARLHYFFKEAFDDLKAVALLPMEKARLLEPLKKHPAVPNLVAKLKKNHSMPAVFFIWPLSLAVVVGVAYSALVALMTYVFLLSLHGMLLVLSLCVFWFTAFILYCMERAVLLARRGYVRCPHAACHSSVSLPSFGCPACGRRHSNLVPGKYGVLSRRCECGKGILPVLSWLGKEKLKSFCPACGNSMHQKLFAANVHVPIYGGPGAGKTMYLMATTWQLVQRKLPDVCAELINDQQRNNYGQVWREGFEKGVLREKTAELLPNAFLLSFQRGRGYPVSLYLYDPAGEALEQESGLRGHRYLTYCDGLALLIDPASLPALARRAEALGTPFPEQTTATSPFEMVNRITNEMENLGRVARHQALRIRLAVVVSKADIKVVRDEMKLNLARIPGSPDWSSLGDRQSEVIREWFLENEPSLLQVLDTRFSEVRFFAASALGGAPAGAATPFTPQGVLHPLCWLLSARLPVRHPTAGLVLGRAAEMMAVALVLFLAAGLPAILFFSYGLPWVQSGWAALQQQLLAEAGYAL